MRGLVKCFFDSLPKGELTIRAVNHIKVLDNWLIDIKELPEDWWNSAWFILVNDPLSEAKELLREVYLKSESEVTVKSSLDFKIKEFLERHA